MSRSGKRRVTRRAALLLCLLASTGMHAAEQGAVTAIAAADQSSTFVGFASGAVFLCSRLSGCTELEGTPTSRVTSLEAMSDGKSMKAWVGYDNGTLYFCTLTGGCILQELVPNPGKSKLP